MTSNEFTDSLGYLNEKYYLAERLLATHPGSIKERLLNVAVSIPLGELKPGSGIPSGVVKLIGSIPALIYANNDDSGRGAAAVTFETMSEEVAVAIAHDICEVHDQLSALEEDSR